MLPLAEVKARAHESLACQACLDFCWAVWQVKRQRGVPVWPAEDLAKCLCKGGIAHSRRGKGVDASHTFGELRVPDMQLCGKEKGQRSAQRVACSGNNGLLICTTLPTSTDLW